MTDKVSRNISFHPSMEESIMIRSAHQNYRMEQLRNGESPSSLSRWIINTLVGALEKRTSEDTPQEKQSAPNTRKRLSKRDRESILHILNAHQKLHYTKEDFISEVRGAITKEGLSDDEIMIQVGYIRKYLKKHDIHMDVPKDLSLLELYKAIKE